MKYWTRFLKWLGWGLILLVALAYFFNVDYLFTAVRTIYFNGHKTAFLDDFKYFPSRVVDTSIAQPWPYSSEYNTVESSDELEKMHQQLETVSFLIVKNDSLWYESYYDNYSDSTGSNSFSMAKSIVSAALGRAIQDGYIESLDTPVISILPEIRGTFKNEVTVGDLSSMSSGLKWDESYYSAFSVTTRAYFDKDLRKMMLAIPFDEKPGSSFIYKSGDTQYLASIIEKTTGMYLSDYVSEKFWKPMGAEFPALWQLDHQDTGIEKAYCCFTSNARDFARFGKLYKDFGKWNGKQLIDSVFVAKSIVPRFKNSPEYGYGWWLAKYKGKEFFYMRGHLGQFVIVNVIDNVIIVRLGHLKGTESPESAHSDDLFFYIDQAYEMMHAKK